MLRLSVGLWGNTERLPRLSALIAGGTGTQAVTGAPPLTIAAAGSPASPPQACRSRRAAESAPVAQAGAEGGAQAAAANETAAIKPQMTKRMDPIRASPIGFETVGILNELRPRTSVHSPEKKLHTRKQ